MLEKQYEVTSVVRDNFLVYEHREEVRQLALRPMPRQASAWVADKMCGKHVEGTPDPTGVHQHLVKDGKRCQRTQPPQGRIRVFIFDFRFHLYFGFCLFVLESGSVAFTGLENVSVAAEQHSHVINAPLAIVAAVCESVAPFCNWHVFTVVELHERVEAFARNELPGSLVQKRGGPFAHAVAVAVALGVQPSNQLFRKIWIGRRCVCVLSLEIVHGCVVLTPRMESGNAGLDIDMDTYINYYIRIFGSTIARSSPGIRQGRLIVLTTNILRRFLLHHTHAEDAYFLSNYRTKSRTLLDKNKYLIFLDND